MIAEIETGYEFGPTIDYASEDTKRCTGCDQVMYLDEFYRCSRAPDGLTYRCKECHRSRAQAATPKNAVRTDLR